VAIGAAVDDGLRERTHRGVLRRRAALAGFGQPLLRVVECAA
jgi:hypothetical protein